MTPSRTGPARRARIAVQARVSGTATTASPSTTVHSRQLGVG